MVEGLQGRRLIQPTDQVQRPECLEAKLPGFLLHQSLQFRHDRRILAVADQPECRLALPLVRIGQQFDQIGCAQAGQIGGLTAEPALRALSR